MLKTKPKPATYSDIEALPPNMVGEIIFDTLQVQTCLPPRLGVAATKLQSEVASHFGQRHESIGWTFLYRPELHLGDHVVVPDIGGWRNERLTPFPETPYIETPPDWLAEILSPSTQAIDRTDKLSLYAEFGVKHCWYVDPNAKTLEVFALTDGKWLIAATFKDADPVTAPPFEVHTFPLDVLWVKEA